MELNEELCKTDKRYNELVREYYDKSKEASDEQLKCFGYMREFDSERAKESWNKYTKLYAEAEKVAEQIVNYNLADSKPDDENEGK